MPLWVVAGSMKRGLEVHIVTGCYVAAAESEVISRHRENMIDEKPDWQIATIRAYQVEHSMVLMAATEILRSQRNAEGSDGDR